LFRFCSQYFRFVILFYSLFRTDLVVPIISLGIVAGSIISYVRDICCSDHCNISSNLFPFPFLHSHIALTFSCAQRPCQNTAFPRSLFHSLVLYFPFSDLSLFFTLSLVVTTRCAFISPVLTLSLSCFLLTIFAYSLVPFLSFPLPSFLSSYPDTTNSLHSFKFSVLNRATLEQRTKKGR
jgi:hypothetical protein